MEYTDGEELFDVISKRVELSGNFSEYETAVIMKKLLQTVEFLHENHIMHKDIKPKKILVTSNGEIKLIDFGLSKWQSCGTHYTTTGTPYYLAPEVLSGVNTSKSDIWSLGVLLYCLLSGTLPFVKGSDSTIFDKASEGDYSFDLKVWDLVSVSAKDLISRMINKDYHNRYSASDCLKHEWFESALSDRMKRKNSKVADVIPSNLNAFKKKIELQSIAAKLITKHMGIKEIIKLKEIIISNSDNSELIDRESFLKIICSINKDMDTTKIEKITRALSHYQEDDKIPYMPIIEELERAVNYNKQSRISVVFYQFLNEFTDLLPCSCLTDIFEQFQQPKNHDEINQIYQKYNIKETDEIGLEKFKQIISSEVQF